MFRKKLKSDGRDFLWEWDQNSISRGTTLDSGNKVVVFNNPSSTGTASVTGNKPFVHGHIYYWEVKFLELVYGTDIMVGIGTDKTAKVSDVYCSLLGMDNESWGLSYRGLIHHGGKMMGYGPFLFQDTVIGLLLDMWKGTLEFFRNGEPLGIAFNGINTSTMLYPMVCSTAAKTSIRLMYCDCVEDTLTAKSLVRLSETESGLNHIRNVPGLKALLKRNWWLVRRDIGVSGYRNVHDILCENFCWPHFSSKCFKCFILNEVFNEPGSSCFNRKKAHSRNPSTSDTMSFTEDRIFTLSIA